MSSADSSRSIDWIAQANGRAVVVTARLASDAKLSGAKALAEIGVFVRPLDVIVRHAFNPDTPAGLDYLVRRVASYIQVPVELLLNTNFPQVTRARKATAYLARTMTSCGVRQIAAAMACSKSAVYALHKQAELMVATDSDFAQYVAELRRLFP